MGVTTYKRWRVREGVGAEEVVRVVREEIVPHYARLSDQVVLGLERWDDEHVVAVQRWRSRDAMEQALAAESYAAWWAAYLPVLERWDALVEIADEWEGDELLA